MEVERKIEGGKILKIKLWARQGKVEKIRFTGDFFVIPERAVNSLEEHLVNLELREQKLIETMVKEALSNADLVGVRKKDFVELILEGLRRLDS